MGAASDDDNTGGDLDVFEPKNGDPCTLTLNTKTPITVNIGALDDRILDILTTGCSVTTYNVSFNGKDGSQ